LHLINMLPKLKNPPNYILIENVKNFEESQTRNYLVNILRELDYQIQEFLLTPGQFQVPNSRLRYYLLAKRSPLKFNYIVQEILYQIPNYENILPVRQIEEFLCNDIDEQYMVPENIILKKGMLFDIVSKNSINSCCFTKGYGRLVEGSGSVLQTGETSNISDNSSLLPLKLRYFSPREIARLHYFPDTFNLCEDVLSRRQLYQLLGNSLNCLVVSELIKYLFS